MSPALFEPLKEALIKAAEKKGLDFGPIRAVDLAKLTRDLQQFMEVGDRRGEGGEEGGREGSEVLRDTLTRHPPPYLQPSLPPSLRMSLASRPSSRERSG